MGSVELPRPPLVIGTWGKIRRRKVSPGVYVADARYRDHDGVTRQISRTGASAQKAEDALKAAMVERLALAADDLTAESTLRLVAERWYSDEIAEAKALNTQRRYREVLDGILFPGLGGVRMREMTVARLDRFLRATATHRGPASAKIAKSVLSGVLGYATRLGAMSTNPLRDVGSIRHPKKPVRVLDLDAIHDFRRRMYANELAVQRDLAEPVDFMLGTGERIGETLAVRWSDLDLDGHGPATATVRATVVWVKGVGVVIQEHPKSTSSRRVLILPTWLADVLRARREVAPPNDLELVFASERGTPRDPSNLRRQFRDLRSAIGYEWVVPHTFRKSVATLAGDDELARAQLGHASSAVTREFYIPKTHLGPDLRAVLDPIDPGHEYPTESRENRAG